MQFQDLHVVGNGDTVWQAAKSRGYSNPGPVVAYPVNAAFFRGRSPNLIRPGERFFVPWHQDVLRKIIATSEYLMSEVRKTADALMREQVHNQKELDEFLFKIDAVNFLANVGVGIASLTAAGARSTAATSGLTGKALANAEAATQKEILIWLVESRATIASNVATMTIPAPTAPKMDFSFYVRHTLGPWNPSYWASVYTAIKDGDVDIYLYGSAATTYKTCLKIKEQAEKDLLRLRTKMDAARKQLAMPFYQHRI